MTEAVVDPEAILQVWLQVAEALDFAEDAMIAAIAKVHQLTVVTRNVGDFSRFDVPLLNPFTSRDQGIGEISDRLRTERGDYFFP